VRQFYSFSTFCNNEKLVEKYKIPPIVKCELYLVFCKFTIAREVFSPSSLQSPDLTPNDFYSLTRWKRFLGGTRMPNDEEDG
jgi:hypothetical protein